jgi:hypothetical protein
VLKRALEIWWEFKNIIGKGILVALLARVIFAFYMIAPSINYLRQLLVQNTGQQQRLAFALLLFFILFVVYILIIFLISRLMFSIYCTVYGVESKFSVIEPIALAPDGGSIRFSFNFYKLYFLLGLPVYVFSYLFFIFPLLRPQAQGLLTAEFSRYFIIDTASTIFNFLVVNFFFVLIFLSTPYAARGKSVVESVRTALISFNNRMGIVFLVWVSLLFVEAVTWFIFSLALAPSSFASVVFTIKQPGFAADLISAAYSLLITIPKGILWSFIITCWFLVALFLSDRKVLIVSHDYNVTPKKMGEFKIPLKRVSIIIAFVLAAELVFGFLGGAGLTFFENNRLKKVSAEQLSTAEIERIKDEPLLLDRGLVSEDELNRYLVEVEINTSNMSIEMNETLIYKNNEGTALSEIYFNVFAAAYDGYETAPIISTEDVKLSAGEINFIPGKTKITDVRVDGGAVDFNLEGTHLKIILREPVQPGERMNIKIGLREVLPKNSERYGYFDNVISLGNWIPLLAVYEDGGWKLDRVVPIGDPFYSESANFEVSIRLPADQVVAATGLLQSVKYDKEDTNKELVFRADGVRDFAVMISKDYNVLNTEAGKTEIYSYYLPDKLAAGENARNIALRAINFFSSEFGEYPFPEFEVVENLNSFGGMEYPCLVQIGYLTPAFPQMIAYFLPDALTKVDEYVIVHETSHQWWYNIVGNDQIREPWLDEALAEYSTFLYFRHFYGEEKAVEITNYFNQSVNGMGIQSQIMSGSIYDYRDFDNYSRDIYTEGSQVLLLLEEEMGQKELREALQEYYSTYMFKVARISDFISICKKHSEKDLSQFFRKYYK